MKRTLFVSIALLAVLLAHWIKDSRSRSDDDPKGMVLDEERIRTQAFWRAYHQATQHRSTGDFERAIQSYQSALELDPTHEESLYYLGNCFFEIGDYDKALKAYEQVTAINPKSHRGFSQLGVVLSTFAPGANPDFERARQAFERNAQLNREESGPFLRLGTLAMNRGDLHGALRHFETAAGFKSPEGHFLAGVVLFHQRRYRDALVQFQEVLEINAREKKITGRGVLSEGDIKSDGSRTSLTPLEAAGIKSLLYLYWAAVKLGESPKTHWKDIETRPSKFRLAATTSGGGLPAGGQGRSAWADYDGDGDPDLALASFAGHLALYRNNHGRFENVTDEVGWRSASPAWDVSWGDYDGDRDQDAYVVRSGFIGQGHNTLYRNDGADPPTFTDVTQRVGLAGQRATARALFWDYDRDGRLDLLEFGNRTDDQPALRLFQNQGEGQFVEISKRAGIQFSGNAVDCALGDYDGDARTDLLVLRWKRSAILFRNQGDGNFSDETQSSGLPAVSGDRFSALFFDYDKDGRQDLLMTSHAPYERAIQQLIQPDFRAANHSPRLFHNKGGSFEEVTVEAGLDHCTGTLQAIAVDVDRDGWTDLVFANGGLESYRLEPSLVLRNIEGRRFERFQYLPAFDSPVNSTGVSAADLNGDGKIDLSLAGAGLLVSR